MFSMSVSYLHALAVFLATVLAGVIGYAMTPFVSTLFVPNKALDEVKRRRNENNSSASSANILDEIAQIEEEIKRKRALAESDQRSTTVRLEDIMAIKEAQKSRQVHVGREELLLQSESANQEALKEELSQRQSDQTAQQSNSPATAGPRMSMTELTRLKSEKRRKDTLEGRERTMLTDKGELSRAELDYNSAMAAGVTPDPRRAEGSITTFKSRINQHQQPMRLPGDRGAGENESERIASEVTGYSILSPPVEVLGEAGTEADIDWQLVHGPNDAPAGPTDIDLQLEREIRRQQNEEYEESLRIDLAASMSKSSCQKDVYTDENEHNSSLQSTEPTAPSVVDEHESLTAETLVLNDEPEESNPESIVIQFQIKMSRQRQLVEEVESKRRVKDIVKVKRRFLSTDEFAQVVAFLRKFCREHSLAKSFEVMCPFPVRVLFSTNNPNGCSSGTLRDLRIPNKCVLYVHPVELD